MEEKDVVISEESGEKAEENAALLSAQKSVEDEKKQEKKERIKKILFYLFFLVVNVAVITVFVLLEDNNGEKVPFSEIIDRLEKNVVFAILSIVSFLLIMAVDIVVFNVLVKKLGYKDKSVLATKAAIYGRYYEKITPWAIGGVPSQIGLLTMGGLSAGESCAVTMSRHIVRFFTAAPIVIVILAASRIAANVWVILAAVLSVSFGLVVPTLMLVCAVKPIVGEKIGAFLIRLLTKIKIVKKPEKAREKLIENVEKFTLGVQYLAKNKGAVLLIAAASVVELFLTNSVPFFVIRSFGYSQTAYWPTLVLCLYVTYAAGFAPTPGGAGLAELSFYAIFATVVPDGYLFWAILFWRVAVFYLPVFIGFLLHLFDVVRGIVRSFRR